MPIRPFSIMPRQYRTDDELDLMKYHQRQQNEAKLWSRKEHARYRQPARQRLLRSAELQDDFVLNRERKQPPANKARQQEDNRQQRSEEHTSELQSLMRISYAVFCLTKKNINHKPRDMPHQTHSKTTNNSRQDTKSQ